jgi:hypothetical protein
MPSLAEIRAKLLQQQQTSPGSGDNSMYPFWNAPEGSTTTIRFLPDADTENVFFWRERQMIRIPFSGILGQDERKYVAVTVPCMEMWNETCPIHQEIRPWFKDPKLEEEARKYWKKRSYIFQGFVVENPLKEENEPENPIRRFVINSSIYKIISAALMDPDFVEVPTDFEQGTDFKLVKTQKGQYADYTTSSWARRERALNQVERDAIEQYSLNNLNDFMPKKPNENELKVIMELFEASVQGELYDPERFSQYYAPPGIRSENNGSSNTADNNYDESTEVKKTEPVKEQVKEDPKPIASGDNKPSANEILEMIRQRKSAS